MRPRRLPMTDVDRSGPGPLHRPRVAPLPAVEVVIISDERLLAEGLLRLLSSEPLLDVSCCPDPAKEISRADVVLVDSRMACAMVLCRHLAHDCGAAVVMMAAPVDDEWACCALGAGARGILSLGMGSGEVISAINSVADGVIWAPRRVISTMLDRLSRGSANLRRETLEASLSTREREILRHAATGLGNKELAARLQISEATVKVHLTHIFQKLGVRCRAELAAAYYSGVHPTPRLRVAERSS